MFQFAASRFRAISLSETPDNLLMWAHYTAEHSGFVIGFDVDHPSWKALEETRGERATSPVRIIYSAERPKRATLKDVQPTDIWSIKSGEWKYEREWRLTRPLELRSRADCACRCSVSTPEATALDLIGYQYHAGGLDQVATVLSELAERIDPEKLAAAAWEPEAEASVVSSKLIEPP